MTGCFPSHVCSPRAGAGFAAALLFAVCASANASAGASAPATSAVTLEWTTPGDDGSIGVPKRYDLRYSREPITPETFYLSKAVGIVPTPLAAGARQSVKIIELEPDRKYYFCLRTVDDAGNWSSMSNVVSRTAPDPARAPGQFAAALSEPFPNPARHHIRVDLTLPRETPVNVTVVDVAGRVMKCLALGPYPAGVTPLYWNLTRDITGVRLGVGQYWVTGVVGEQRFAQRLTVLEP